MRDLDKMTPEDKQMAAISILQMHILSLDSQYTPESVFGRQHMQTYGLELAERLMHDALEALPPELLEPRFRDPAVDYGDDE